MFDMGVNDNEIRELQLKLRNMPVHLNKGVHLAALRKAAKPLRDELDHTTPFEYGTLVADLRIRTSRFQDVNEHSVIVGYKGGTGHVGFVGRFLEYGTKYIAERRFMRKAEANNLAKMEEIYRREIQSRVDGVLNG